MRDKYFDVLVKTLDIVQGSGKAELTRLLESLGYWAPEVRQKWFWYGQGTIMGYLDILNNYYQDNEDVRQLYKTFKETFENKPIEV
jgi:hypothetical protein